MYYLPVFLCFFLAELSLYNIMKSRDTKPLSQSSAVFSVPKSLRTAADKLDYEILIRQKDNLTVSDIKIESEINGNLYNNTDNASDNYENASALYKTLNIYAAAGISAEALKNNLTALIKAQFYSGDMPDYIMGGKYINESGYGALTLPLAAAEYINYTGDSGILDESICYNGLCSNPLCDIRATEFCESVYQHITNALNTEKIHGEREENNIILERLGIDKAYNKIVSRLLYCISAEAFLPYIKDYGYKLDLIEKISIIKRDSADTALNSTQKASGRQYAEACMLNLLCKGVSSEDMLKELFSLNSEINAASPFIKILFISFLIKNSKIAEAFGLIKGLDGARLGVSEKTLFKKVLLKDIFGISFKQGMLALKPKGIKYDVSFNFSGKKVSIKNLNNSGGGIYVDRLLFNNIDYIPLGSYNKDIDICL
jgi:hypothetical protein